MLVDVLATYRGWRRSPPAHWLKAAELGFKPKPAELDEKVSTEAEIDAFLAELNG